MGFKQAYDIIGQRTMGNAQPKKVNKNQIEIACLKSRIHLEMMRDRKNAEIIKGEKELVNKLKATSRNRTEEALIMERVVNGLKYSQAVNQLMAYAASLKAQSAFLADNIGNQERLQPWLPQVYTLLFAADHLGLSSLNQFKNVMKQLNNPMVAEQYVNPEIRELLTPTPTPYEINIYVLEMVQRNGLSLELVNMAGHKFKEHAEPPQEEGRKSFSEIQKQLAEQFQKSMGQDPKNGGNQGFGGHPGGSQGFGNPGYGNQGYGNQGGFGGGNQGYGGNYPGNQGGSFGVPPVATNGNSYQSNPYKGLSNINDGPQYYNPSNIEQKNMQKPKQFPSFDSVIRQSNPKGNQPVYPDVNPQSYGVNGQYKPKTTDSHFSQPGDDQSGQKSPTMSQIMRDFDIK